jgi:hypothetical protein
MINGLIRSPGYLHRSGITAVDKLSAITITAANQAGVVGVMANASHNCAVAPRNAYGSVGASAIVAVTPTLNKTVDITVPQCEGATHYDVFFSTDAAPLWVGSITEAQRAAGCAITAVGTVGAGGSAGVVNVRLVGTGAASSAYANNAYSLAGITEIDTRSKTKAYVYVSMTLTDFRTAPTLSIVPFLKNAYTGLFAQAQAQAVSLLAAVGQSLNQVFAVDVDGSEALKVPIGTLTGYGASVNIHIELV